MTTYRSTRKTRLKNVFQLNNQTLVAWIMLLPTLFMLGVFVYYLMLQAFTLSFFKSNVISGAKTFIGLKNFEFLFTKDRQFIASVQNTFVYTFFNMSFGLVLALMLSLICQKTSKLINLFRTATFIPVVIPMVTAGLIWKLMLEPQFGIVNQFIALFGGPKIKWLFSSTYALPTVIFVSVWKEVGMYTMIFVGGLQQIPGDLYEAAAIDGSNSFQKFIHITIPLLKPTIFFVSMMLLITSFKVFDQVWIMTQGGPGSATLTLTAYIYGRIFDNPGLANAGSVVLFGIVMILTVGQWMFFERSGDKK